MAENGYNAAEMKRRNRQRIIELLRIKPRSRADLAREMGLTRAAISVLADAMIEEGLLLNGEPVNGGGGRRTVGLRLNGNRYHMLAVSIMRDVCSVGLANFAGDILRILEVKTDDMGDSLPEALQTLGNMTDELLSNPAAGEFLGIGISAPGPLNRELGEILNPPAFDRWHHARVAEWFRKKYQCPVYLENIAKSLALAEKYYGGGYRYRDYLEMIVADGIGSGIVIDGRLYHGISGFAGEIGHMTVDLNGERCACGNRGCLELYASIPNLLAFGRERGIVYPSWSVMMDRLGEEEGARLLYEREVKLLTAALVGAVNFTDIQTVILQGDILYRADILAADLQAGVNRSFIGRESKRVAVYPSALGENARILAGINLVLENTKPEGDDMSLSRPE